MNNSREKPRIWVDFNNAAPGDRVWLTSVGTIEDLNRSGLILMPGMEVCLYSTELEADGVVEFAPELGGWVAKIDWDQIRDRDN